MYDEIKLNEMSLVEIKALLFDIEQEMRQKQNLYNQVLMHLEKKSKEVK